MSWFGCSFGMRLVCILILLIWKCLIGGRLMLRVCCLNMVWCLFGMIIMNLKFGCLMFLFMGLVRRCLFVKLRCCIWCWWCVFCVKYSLSLCCSVGFFWCCVWVVLVCSVMCRCGLVIIICCGKYCVIIWRWVWGLCYWGFWILVMILVGLWDLCCCWSCWCVGWCLVCLCCVFLFICGMMIRLLMSCGCICRLLCKLFCWLSCVIGWFCICMNCCGNLCRFMSWCCVWCLLSFWMIVVVMLSVMIWCLVFCCWWCWWWMRGRLSVLFIYWWVFVGCCIGVVRFLMVDRLLCCFCCGISWLCLFVKVVWLCWMWWSSILISVLIIVVFLLCLCMVLVRLLVVVLKMMVRLKCGVMGSRVVGVCVWCLMCNLLCCMYCVKVRCWCRLIWLKFICLLVMCDRYRCCMFVCWKLMLWVVGVVWCCNCWFSVVFLLCIMFWVCRGFVMCGVFLV